MLAPRLADIEEQFKGKNIVYISISIDKEKDFWKQNIASYSGQSAIALYTNGEADKHPVIKYAGIFGYPTLFLIDKEGKLLEANMNISSDQIVGSIKNALN
jgi:thiol-disulfide isomerase/thioredoxin